MHSDTRTMHIRGNGHAEIMPDTIKICLTLENHHHEYDKAVIVGHQQLEILYETLSSADLGEDEISIRSFNVYNKRVKLNKSDDVDEYEIIYVCKQVLELTIPMDMKRLQHIVALCTCSTVLPEISIRLCLKDDANAQKQVLDKAVADARRKAEILADAADISLGEILNIDNDEVNSYYPVPDSILYHGAPDKNDSMDMPQVKKIDLDASVDITWAIN